MNSDRTSHDEDISTVRVAADALPIAVDVMGGDFGPEGVVEGAIDAASDLGINSVLVGHEDHIRPLLNRSERGRELLRRGDISIHHATEVVGMDESPALAIRGKANASIRVAFELVKNGGAAAVVSPGNSGAVMAAGLFVAGTLPGIARPAIASLVPKVGARPTVLLDSGANVDCHAHQLVQFALMGSAYAHSAFSIERPRVGLLANGSEPSKGNDVTRAAAQLLAQVREFEFVGYIEGRDLAEQFVDVAVCDGFVGNIVLKTMEGTASLVLDSIKTHVDRGLLGRIGMALVRPGLARLFQEKLDPSAYGGAPLLGLNEVVVVCHGASGRRAIMNGIRVARKFIEDGVVERTRAALASFDLETVLHGPGRSYEDGIWSRMGDRFSRKAPSPRDREGARGGHGSSEEER